MTRSDGSLYGRRDRGSMLVVTVFVGVASTAAIRSQLRLPGPRGREWA